MPTTIHRMPWSALPQRDPELLLHREWLVTNGLGGYASGTVSGACTRRYHGLLIAALPAPLGRVVMFNHLAEELKFEDRQILRLDTEDLSLAGHGSTADPLGEFRLESGLPVWHYDLGAIVLEKRVLLPYLQNTVYITYRVLAAAAGIRLRLRPSLHFRPHEAPVNHEVLQPYAMSVTEDRIEVRSAVAPPLRMRLVADRASLVCDGGRYREIHYRLERARGYDDRGQLWTPGYFRADLSAGSSATLIASAEDWETLQAIDPVIAWEAELQRRERLVAQALPEAQTGRAPELVLAADQFIIRPTTRVADAAMAHASGDDVRTVIAGYHWFTDWGRDTMISLEGLTLVTGRQSEAGYLLRTFGRYVRDGLIPNLFPEGGKEGLYHTADATLWYFHALHRYLQNTQDWETLQLLLPTLKQIIERHVQGTHFGIRVDPADGLLTQGQAGYQLTWMDAKVGDWVVTPRRGKAVEINGLWYNALRLLEHWCRTTSDETTAAWLAERAEQARTSFNRRFWYAQGEYLYDVIDGEQGNDTAFRPNQLFAFSLDHPVLDAARWQPVLEQVIEKLLSPVGLRSLAPDHPDYKPTYHGDLRSRDAAYHQGTIWAWLIGPCIDAWCRVYPEKHSQARDFLAGFEPHLGDACVGSISEVFDAQAPYTPRGCVAQAWSVAEYLRCWVKTASPNVKASEAIAAF